MTKEGAMRRWLRLLAATTAIAVAAGIATAVGAFAQEESPSGAQEKVTFTVGSTNDAITFNPMFMIETPEYNTADLVYDKLLSWSQEDFSTVPDLATDWEQSDDGLTWTFTIRDDATWHDGTPLTARDIAFTFNWIIGEGAGNLLSYFPFTEAGDITAPDDTTLVWTTSTPTSAPAYPPYVYVLPESVLSQYEDKADFRTWKGFPDPVGSGPFKLVEWRRGDFWRLQANPDYYGGAPHIDEFIFRVFQNEDAMIEALKQGEIDFADDVSSNFFESIQNEPNIATNVGNPTRFVQMSFNQCTNEVDYCRSEGFNHHPATTDPQFRLAVEYAIDREALVERVKLGYASPSVTVILAPKWHHDPPEVITYDPDEANRILDEAGYIDTDNDGIRETPDGQPLELRFIVRTESPETITAGEFIVEWLRDVGIRLNTEAINDNKLTDVWYANDYDMYIWGWGVEPDPDFQLSTYATFQCGVWSDTCYSNPQYDQLYKDQQRATSIEERAQIVDQMQQIIYEDRPELVLWYDNYLQAYRRDLWTGFVKQPTEGGSILFQYGHYSDLNVRPTSAAAGGGDEGGVPALVWIAVAAVVLVVVGVVFSRRRRAEEEVA
ncbi:MAG TPA: ABC transporter substrate-binding protein [Actinomycetota bacterium]|nr:ABC transporter substrate-binding protein [Actinomycetota bacterium]